MKDQKGREGLWPVNQTYFLISKRMFKMLLLVDAITVKL